MIGAEISTLSTGHGQLHRRIGPILAKPIKKNITRRVSDTVESEAHRAAKLFSSVGLKCHVVVHRQLSTAPHGNLRSGVSALAKSHPRGWGSIMNPFDGAWSTAAANQTNPHLAKPIAEYHYGRIEKQCSPETPNGRAPPADRACA